jgi:ribonucleoside-diphosphate reductase alpha chain
MEEPTYFHRNELAANVWASKYKDKFEKDPSEMHHRMSLEFAKADLMRKNGTRPKLLEAEDRAMYYYNLMHKFKYIVPQGSVQAVLGTNLIASLSNCFVIGQPDNSYGGIMQKDQELVQLMKRRGGVGIDLSTLAPAGTSINNAAKTSTGAVSFMHRYSNSTREVAQEGRRGALMLALDCRHPDIANFAVIKRDLSKVTGANISVQLRDDFMLAVEDDDDYILRWPCEIDIDPKDYKDKPYDTLIHLEQENFYIKKIKARKLNDEIIKSAWMSAEPGQMFIDRHWDRSPDTVYPQYKGIVSNPCGEIFMSAYDACRLIVLNLYSFVADPFTKEAVIDWKKLYTMAYELQVMGDLIVDLEIIQIRKILDKILADPESTEVKATELQLWKKVLKITKSGRRTGCGLTGLGDMLAAIDIRYGGDESLEVVDKVMSTMMEAQLTASIDMAEQYGPFTGWDPSKEYSESDGTLLGNNTFYRDLYKKFPNLVNRMIKVGRRNVSWSTVAPCGSVSILTETSSGLEPAFNLFHIRRKKINPNDKYVRVDFVDQNKDSWQEYPVVHPKFKTWLAIDNNICLDSAADWIENLSADEITELVATSPWAGSTAEEVNWKSRIALQSVIQDYTTHSISSTINLPNDVTLEEVEGIYMESWKKGLKGVTIYRDGSRSGVIVTKKEEKKENFETHDAPKRPQTLPADVHISKCMGIEWIVGVGLLDEKPYEVFAQPTKWTLSKRQLRGDITKKGRGEYSLQLHDLHTIENFASNMTDEQAIITRLVSTSLRHGADIKYVVEQLNKTPGDLKSFGKVIARTLKRYIPDGEEATGAKCPDCGASSMVYEEGCQRCQECGHSAC